MLFIKPISTLDTKPYVASWHGAERLTIITDVLIVNIIRLQV
jgi:hypothetical protein